MAEKKEQKPKKQGTISQIIQIYKFTAQDDKQLPFLIAGAIVIPIVAAVIVAVLWFSWITDIFTIILGVMVGLLFGTLVLTRRADKVGFRQMDGRPGATGAILNNITKGGFSFPQEPVWVDAKTKDAIWRGTGRTGVYLVGEGEYGRVMKAIDKEEAKVKRITRGSDIPVIKICVGHGEKQVPLDKLQKTVMKQKVKLTKYELDELNSRLKTLQAKNTMGMPKGMDPSRMHVSRRAMRGR
ncbi:hypothetical protein CS006_09065 [Bifidobacterium primatium]|uniref:DUF4191 domain-containing protein n=2 Tax=Bifidobacterium TaxID=1678 RepID=A0A2M9H7A7_9BIFI|nr:MULTISPECIES: DUF4191 domain-containing protein [Bifidobacterium]NEG95690.1 DUF4191 family protein [Bifidobacterium sp. SMB2]NEH11117.1 DUF4191 family protein [Bifidobacterium saimiriisciurei]PJM72700.1 hypothetical protein CS006_09065 [Bifidobacterium primatium]